MRLRRWRKTSASKPDEASGAQRKDEPLRAGSGAWLARERIKMKKDSKSKTRAARSCAPSPGSASLDARKEAALAKIRLHDDAWKNGDPGEAMSPRRLMLVDALYEGRKELGEVNRINRKMELSRRESVVRQWLSGRVRKDRIEQILAWMHCKPNVEPSEVAEETFGLTNGRRPPLSLRRLVGHQNEQL